MNTVPSRVTDNLGPKAGSSRFTFEILASGQPRPYADSHYHWRLTIEHVSYIRPPGAPRVWEPRILSAPEARRAFEGFGVVTPATPLKTDDREWHVNYIDHMVTREPGVWELLTITPYAD